MFLESQVFCIRVHVFLPAEITVHACYRDRLVCEWNAGRRDDLLRCGVVWLKSLAMFF